MRIIILGGNCKLPMLSPYLDPHPHVHVSILLFIMILMILIIIFFVINLLNHVLLNKKFYPKYKRKKNEEKKIVKEKNKSNRLSL